MISDKSLADEAAACLRRLLPAGWRLEPVQRMPPGLAWLVEGPDGRQANLDLRVTDAPAPRTITPVQAGATLVMVSRFLSPATRARLDDLGWSYADTTGNIAICLPSPGLVIRVAGAPRDPGPRQRPNRTLKGPGAARLIRALCDAPLPLTLSDLGRRAGIDLGYASRVLEWMAHEDLVTRHRRGPVTRVDLRALLTRWADAYGVLTTHHAMAARDPAGAAARADRLKALSTRYAITGTFAANRLAVFAPRRPMLVYAEQPATFIEELELAVGTDDPDVVVIAPADPVVFERTWSTGGFVFTAPSQIVVDLLTGPHEGRAFADDVIAWMVQRRQ